MSKKSFKFFDEMKPCTDRRDSDRILRRSHEVTLKTGFQDLHEQNPRAEDDEKLLGFFSEFDGRWKKNAEEHLKEKFPETEKIPVTLN